MSDSYISDLENELNQNIKGEVRFSEIDKVIYSTDASNYQIKPVGVVIPRTQEDIINIVSIAKEYEVSIIARGGGTGLAGQSIGHGIIIDFSKYFNGIKFVDTDKKSVLVQPGLYLETLNNYLENFGLMFGPDPSSARVATLGGVIGNNATGAHSILYGMSGDHINSAEVILSDGSLLKLSTESYVNPGSQSNPEILDNLKKFTKKNKKIISDNFPKHWRRASGYSLNYLLDKNFNPAKLLASSEGTLAIATEFELNLVERPKFKALCVLQFNELVYAVEVVPEILKANPSAIELVDGLLLELTRKQKGYSNLLSYFKDDPSAVLVVEFFGESQREVELKAKDFLKFIDAKNINCRKEIIIDERNQSDIWNLRKVGLGLLMSKRSEFKPIPCIEDVSVPVGQLSNYVRELISVINKLKLKAGFYGHASAGCLHIRPLINLRQKKGVSQMGELTDAALKLALKYGGVLSGEHGDGLQRSDKNKLLFGDAIYDVMCELKKLFDPDNILNPNKIVDGLSSSENLRLQNVHSPIELKTLLNWSEQDGLTNATLMCNGQGLCRNIEDGIMCPSYKATKDEKDTTRARANVLRSFLNGEFLNEDLIREDIFDVFDLCIGCKACKMECPSSVDVSKMKTEFLAQYKKAKGFTLRDKLFSNIHSVNSALTHLSPVVNFFTKNKISRKLLSTIGIESRRTLPKLSAMTFSKWFDRFGNIKNKNYESSVVYFHDTWTEFYYPQIGESVVRLLNASGFEVIIEKKRMCCGRPMISNGMLYAAKENALKNITLFAKYVDRRIPIIFSEPSCLSSFRDDYQDIISNSEKLERLEKNIFSVDEFLYANKEKLKAVSNDLDKSKVFIHGHCHQRSVDNFENTLELLKYLGIEVEDSKAGCCGMAGSFGYEKEHYEISRLIGEDRLFQKIKDLDTDCKICVTGVSCLEQISHFTNKNPLHLLELLADNIGIKNM